MNQWNCHQHKDELKISDGCTIYHPEQGVLCCAENHWDVVIFHPVVFKDKMAAQTWIESGCIADIQESLHSLKVGFSRFNLKERQT